MRYEATFIIGSGGHFHNSFLGSFVKAKATCVRKMYAGQSEQHDLFKEENVVGSL